jgi:hypothetical protein
MRKYYAAIGFSLLLAFLAGAQGGTIPLLGAGGAASGGGPFTVVYSATDTSDSPGWQGFNLATVIGTANLLTDASATNIRVQMKFTAASAAGTIDEEWVCEQGTVTTGQTVINCDGNQVQMKFSGSNSFTLAGGAQTVVSDFVPYTQYTTAKPFIIRAHFTSGGSIGLRQVNRVGNDTWFLSGASQAGVTAPTGTWTDNGAFTPGAMEIDGQP